MNPRRKVFLLLLALVAAGTLRAESPAISGDYEDEGVLADGAAADFAGGVSLGALLSMEFEPALVRKLHEQISKVSVRQGDGALKAIIYDREGAVFRQGRWNRSEQTGARAYLYFRNNDEQILLLLEPAAEGRMLQVTLQRSKATAFGPVFRTVAVCLFHRL
ncbi:MAG: hypothetical protein JWQ62_2775 [Lacunisphaera sp.]|nr:hypothetical protein [Lacunisphaera sp.]